MPVHDHAGDRPDTVGGRAIVILRHEDHLGGSDAGHTVSRGEDEVPVRAVNHAGGTEMVAEAGAARGGEQRADGRGPAEIVAWTGTLGASPATWPSDCIAAVILAGSSRALGERPSPGIPPWRLAHRSRQGHEPW